MAERERVDRALRESEDRYRDLVENSQDLICTHDLEGRVLSANKVALQNIGCSLDAALRSNVADLLVPGERPLFRAYLDEIRSSGRAQGIMRVRTTAGETRFWEYDNTLRTDSGDGPVVRGVARDITERKRAEQALKSSEERFRALIEHGLDFISLLAADGTLLWESPAVIRPLGYPPGAFVGRNIFELVHPDDADYVRQSWAQVVQQPASHQGGVFRLRRRDGLWCWVEAGVTNLLHNPSVQAIVVNYRDITERRQAEETLRLQGAALNAAANATVITDRHGAIEWINPAFTALTGYSAGETLGRNPRDLVKSGVHDSAFYAQLWETLLAGGVWRGEMINRRKDGSRYPEEQVITPVRNAQGEITHFIAIKRDLTDEKRVAVQHLQSQKMETVGRLAGGIAHDFNNLLTVINGTADLALMDMRQEDPLRADLEQIHGAGTRAAALTRQLLAFSRQQIMKPTLLDLNTVIENMRAILPRLIGEHIALVIAPARPLGSVLADPGQIEQVILNLAVNARDAMPDGGTLTMETRDVECRSTPSGPHVMLAVSDTGIGIDEATQLKIFEPFFTTKEHGKGTGLGLSTVDGIIRQSGGSISVDSEIGKGTTFTIYLPRVLGIPSRSQPIPTSQTAPGTETILVVEDETMLCQLAARILRSAGYTVLTAGSAEDALLTLERQDRPVHLLFTDVVLPGMNGRELATRVVAAHPDVRVLYTSGYTDDAILRLHVRDEATHFVGKPYTATKLTQRVRGALDSRT
ncbi:MAG: PAS domain S-box protein [Acidobacteria bacterium]|nr:PAS domain S-box protein [Acidobacteriota bacterium]